jgi:glucan biosynthesis protein C
MTTPLEGTAPASRPIAAAHRPDVDWLRVLATYLLFVFHAAKVYDVPPFYHVKDTVLSEPLGYFTSFVHLWHMPLFFVLAGWSALGSLRMRRIAAFLRERASKLLVPLVFGIVAIGPFLRWAELRTGQFVSVDGERLSARPAVGFLAYLPEYFSDPGQLTWGHLWFLAYLATFTLLAAPVLAAFAHRPSRGGDAPRWLVYAPIVPLAIVQVTLRDRWPGFQNLVDDWANFSYYLLFFLLGAALAWAPGFERSAHRETRTAGTLAIAAALAMIPLGELRAQGVLGAASVFRILSAVAGWSAVVACLGLAARRLRFSNRASRWLTESAYPVYFLHQAGVVGAALVVLPLSLGIPAKLALTTALAVLVTLAVYEWIVRRRPALRFLLGMKPFLRGPDAPDAAAPRSEPRPPTLSAQALPPDAARISSATRLTSPGST